MEFILNSKLLLNDRRPPQDADRLDKGKKKGMNPMLAAVKVMCSPLLFAHEHSKHHVFAVEMLQRTVYAATNKAPLYEGIHLTEVNMEWVMKCMDFFRHHMMNHEVLSLTDAMEDLTALQKPTAWQEPLRNGPYPLSRGWRGTYSYLNPNEQRKLRLLADDDDESEAFFSDKNIDEGKIQVPYLLSSLFYDCLI